MAIAKTKLVSFSSNIDNIDNVLMRFIDLPNFHPVPANKIIDTVHGLTSFTSENPCLELINDIKEIEEAYGFTIELEEIRMLEDDFDKIRDFVYSAHEKLKQSMNTVKEFENNIKKYEEALQQLKNIESLDISLDDLFQTKYVAVRVGKIPTDSIERLKYYKSKPYIFKSFKVEDSFSYCMYFTTNEYEREIDNLFSSLFFERIRIPDFVHGTPEKAKEQIEDELKLAYSELAKIREQIRTLAAEQSERLSTIKSELYMLNDMYEAKKYVVGMGERFEISGFAEEKDIDMIYEQFKGIEGLEIDVMPADSDKRIEVPTKLKNNLVFRPFEMYTEMYGLPKYGKIDPTPIVAITYSLLFGIMFGDMGQGILLAILGFFLYKFKKMRLGGIMVSIGICSTVFGFFYGSLFGYEGMSNWFYDLIGTHPIHIMDSSFTMTLLLLTVAFGIVLILVAMTINIIQRAKNKEYAEMVLSHNGVCGFIFYGYLMAALAPMVMGMMLEDFSGGYDIFKIYFIIPFMIIPLILIFLKEPLERLFAGHKMFPNGFGGFFVEAFFELFETLLSYITSTISFMRVGGFVISHAGMMLVVHTLMSMVGGDTTFGGILVAIIGNLFVMGLEGLVVGIQGLRLEFYEMFSRYYDGGGIAFEASKKEIGGV